MKKEIFLCAVMLASSAIVHAENRYRSTSKDQLFCNTVYDAEAAFKASMDGGDGISSERIGQGKPCDRLRPDQTFAVANGDVRGDGVKTITNIAHNTTTYMAYLAGPIEKVAETREPVDNDCKAGDSMPSGEVDKMVAGKDGTLKLKRFMVTTTCVNGQMKSSTKPLN